MKKYCALLLCLILCASLAGCASEDEVAADIAAHLGVTLTGKSDDALLAEEEALPEDELPTEEDPLADGQSPEEEPAEEQPTEEQPVDRTTC